LKNHSFGEELLKVNISGSNDDGFATGHWDVSLVVFWILSVIQNLCNCGTKLVIKVIKNIKYYKNNKIIIYLKIINIKLNKYITDKDKNKKYKKNSFKKYYFK